MCKDEDQEPEDFPLVAEQKDFDGFYTTLVGFAWNQASHKQSDNKVADEEEVVRFFLKVYGLLAAMFTSLYLMTFILLITRQSKLENNESVYFRFDLYFGSFVCIAALGVLAYFSEISRKFPINIILFLTFTTAASYLFGNPLAMLLQAGFYNGTDGIILLYFFSMTLGSFACIMIYLYRDTNQHKLSSNYVILAIVVVMLFLLFIFIMTAPVYIGALIGCFAFHVIYGYLLIVDTRLIISGKFSLKTNQYISGALYLYLDGTVLIVFFLAIVLYAKLRSLAEDACWDALCSDDD